jgi:hypothetical protein
MRSTSSRNAGSAEWVEIAGEITDNTESSLAWHSGWPGASCQAECGSVITEQRVITFSTHVSGWIIHYLLSRNIRFALNRTDGAIYRCLMSIAAPSSPRQSGKRSLFRTQDLLHPGVLSVLQKNPGNKHFFEYDKRPLNMKPVYSQYLPVFSCS